MIFVLALIGLDDENDYWFCLRAPGMVPGINSRVPDRCLMFWMYIDYQTTSHQSIEFRTTITQSIEFRITMTQSITGRQKSFRRAGVGIEPGSQDREPDAVATRLNWSGTLINSTLQDIAVGNCGLKDRPNADCIWVANTGDNGSSRDDYALLRVCMPSP